MKRIAISGGGTGGHVFPALAIAREIRRRYPEASVLFVGARDKIEMKKVPEAGFPIKGLWISGWQRGKKLANLLFPVKLVLSLLRCMGILIVFRPQLAIGTGGFASGPLLKAAAWLGIPYVLQEQNSYAGVTNRLLARKARKIFVAYEGMDRYFPVDRVVLTGNPVRPELTGNPAERGAALRTFGLSDEKLTLLVLGGSLGAGRLNECIGAKLDEIRALGLQLIWQCGPSYIDRYRERSGEGVVVTPFIDSMQHAYAAADLILSRSGAGTVSELMLQGKATLLVPSPNVAEDHQTQNAKALSERGAAVLLPERELEIQLVAELTRLVREPEYREELGEQIAVLARPRATEDIVDQIEQLL